MKVAVTSQGKTPADLVDPRFGRAKTFVVVDTETGACAALDNTVNMNAPQGAGIQSAQRVAAAGAEALVTGNVGPKAFRVLAEASVRVYLTEDCTVAEALERFKKGGLKELKAANVEGHWM